MKKAQHVGAVYDTVSNTLRSLVMVEYDHELDDPAHTHNHHPQLKMLRIPFDEFHQMGTRMHHHIHAKLQKKHVDEVIFPRCAVINADGVVVQLIMAHPGVDHVEGCTLQLSQTLNIGDKA